MPMQPQGMPMQPQGMPMQPQGMPMQPQGMPMQPQGMRPQGMQPPPMLPGNYGGWGLPAQLPAGASPAVQAMYDRQPQRQSDPQARRFRRYRRTPLKPWMLVIGALIMALLAFAVTRACIHTATSRPAAESR
jgi:hypothetical protein